MAAPAAGGVAQLSESGVDVEDSVQAPVAPPPEELRDFLERSVPRLTLGLIRVEDGAQWLGPIKLIGLGPPHARGGGWVREIRDGALVARRGGTVTTRWLDGRAWFVVEGYHPILPRSLYRLTQLPFHHLVARLALLDLRGRIPAVAIPAPVDLRLAAAAVDLAVCAAAARLLRRRFLTVAVVYHLAAWTWWGRTPGGALAGLRVVSLDGSPVHPGQALVRLLALPLAWVRRRALHDEAAGTEVIQARQSRS